LKFSHRLKTGARRQPALPVHTQPFAFHAPQEDDESVKMSNTIGGRPSGLSPTLTATRPRTARLQNRQFLFRTNEPFSRSANFATHTQQSTSFFLFNTNERPLITTHQSLFTNLGEVCRSAEPGPSSFATPRAPCRLTPPSPLRTMRRMRQKPCPGARAKR
jgi:hypothetical protein